MDGLVDYVLSSVGSGGTICGIGLYMKQQSPATSIIAIEPKGSAIFGGETGSYLSAGAGMSYPPGLIKEHGHVIDYFCQVDDAAALRACEQFGSAEGFCVGITAGSVLVVASYLADRYPDKRIVAVAADGGDKYTSFFATAPEDDVLTPTVTLCKYTSGRTSPIRSIIRS
jgi:cysteine synthase